MKKHNCQKSSKIIFFKKGDDCGTMLLLLFLSTKNFSSKCCFQMKNCSSWREQGNCITTLRVVGVYSDNFFFEFIIAISFIFHKKDNKRIFLYANEVSTGRSGGNFF